MMNRRKLRTKYRRYLATYHFDLKQVGEREAQELLSLLNSAQLPQVELKR